MNDQHYVNVIPSRLSEFQLYLCTFSLALCFVPILCYVGAASCEHLLWKIRTEVVFVLFDKLKKMKYLRCGCLLLVCVMFYLFYISVWHYMTSREKCLKCLLVCFSFQGVLKIYWRYNVCETLHKRVPFSVGIFVRKLRHILACILARI